MPVLPYPKSNLDGQQALSYGFDDATQSFRTTATFSGSISVDLDPLTDGVHLGDPDTGDTLQINADGSINANIAISHTTDSVRLGDGTSYLTSTTIGADVGLDVNIIGPSPLVVQLDQNAISQTPYIANLAMPTAGTEYSHVFALNTKKISIKSRLSGKLKVAFISGNSGTTYFTVFAGYEYIFENLDTAATTLYAQSSKASDVLEIVYWD